MTNCADTDLVAASSTNFPQSSLANLFVSHEVFLWSVSVQEDPWDDRDHLNVSEEATACPSEKDDLIREWS